MPESETMQVDTSPPSETGVIIGIRDREAASGALFPSIFKDTSEVNETSWINLLSESDS